MDVFVPGFSREIEPAGDRCIIHTHTLAYAPTHTGLL